MKRLCYHWGKEKTHGSPDIEVHKINAKIATIINNAFLYWHESMLNSISSKDAFHFFMNNAPQ